MNKCGVVFGVSGVGKTTLCKAYLENDPNWLFVSASTLLKNAKRKNAEELRTAGSENIVNNQAVLGDALQNFRKDHEDNPILVDAHGVIDNNQELVEIPVEVIASLNPDILILIQDTPQNVIRNRNFDKSRNRPVRSLDFVENEINQERKVVENYSRILNRKLYILYENKEEDFCKILKNI